MHGQQNIIYLEKIYSSGRKVDVYVENAWTDQYNVEFCTDLFYTFGSLRLWQR